MAEWSKEIATEITAALMERANAECAGEVDRIMADLDIPYPPASSPGQPPARRSGDLRKSINYDLADTDNGIKIKFFADESIAPYADYVEAMDRLVLGHIESRADDLIGRIVGKV